MTSLKKLAGRVNTIGAFLDGAPPSAIDARYPGM
jgi:hypothetical protein